MNVLFYSYCCSRIYREENRPCLPFLLNVSPSCINVLPVVSLYECCAPSITVVVDPGHRIPSKTNCASIRFSCEVTNTTEVIVSSPSFSVLCVAETTVGLWVWESLPILRVYCTLVFCSSIVWLSECVWLLCWVLSCVSEWVSRPAAVEYAAASCPSNVP
jgi:hypothetical protein